MPVGRTLVAERVACGKRVLKSCRSEARLEAGVGTRVHISGGETTDESDDDALRFQTVSGDDVGVALIGGAEEKAAVLADEALERGLGVVDEGGDDVAGASFATFEGDEVAVEDVGVDHRIAADAEEPEVMRAGATHAEESGIDGDGFVGRLLLHGGEASGDGAVDGRVEEMRLHAGGFEAPFSVGEFFELLLISEGAEVAHDGGLAGVELAADLARGGGHAVDALVLFDEIEDLILAFGEHEGVQLNATQLSGYAAKIKRENLLSVGEEKRNDAERRMGRVPQVALETLSIIQRADQPALTQAARAGGRARRSRLADEMQMCSVRMRATSFSAVPRRKSS
jgi:hypothetical protein